MLRQLAHDDFAWVRRNPPLLYHNDLTATVARYYWSEDAGYAIWLRLAHQAAAIGHATPAGEPPPAAALRKVSVRSSNEHRDER